MSDKFTFWDVEGVPVRVGPRGVAEAFDSTPPRRFPYTSVERNGIKISASEFKALADAERGSATARSASSTPSRPDPWFDKLTQTAVDRLNEASLAGKMPDVP